MAQMGYTADATNLPEGGGGDYALLTPGDYPARAVSAEIRDTKKGGKMVVWEFTIDDGPSAGRKIWDQQNIANPPGYVQTGKADPADIGQRHNNQFAAAINLMQGADDTDNYLMKPVIIVVHVEKGTNGFSDKNIVKAFKPASGGAAPRSAAGNASSGAAKPTNTGGSTARSNSGSKPKAAKGEDGKWYDEDGNIVPFFKLSGYEKVEG